MNSPAAVADLSAARAFDDSRGSRDKYQTMAWVSTATPGIRCLPLGSFATSRAGSRRSPRPRVRYPRSAHRPSTLLNGFWLLRYGGGWRGLGSPAACRRVTPGRPPGWPVRETWQTSTSLSILSARIQKRAQPRKVQAARIACSASTAPSP